uniref:Rab-like1 n=1 Tax=Suberites domuncula TaxID=55567 RepID=A1XKT4_SUBDO|nr:Rab-like1 [Suberites domuncula]
MTVSTAAITFVDFPQDKVTLAGNSGVGKTTLFLRFKLGQFIENPDSIGCEGEFRKNWPVDGEEVSMTLYDTAGIERYAQINSTYFRRSRVVIFMYDISDRETFDSLTHWEREAVEKSFTRGQPEIITALVGNKVDLEDERQVTNARALQFADNYCIPKELVFEISAKSGEGVSEMFDAIIRAMLLKGTNQRNLESHTLDVMLNICWWCFPSGVGTSFQNESSRNKRMFCVCMY